MIGGGFGLGAERGVGAIACAGESALGLFVRRLETQRQHDFSFYIDPGEVVITLFGVVDGVSDEGQRRGEASLCAHAEWGEIFLNGQWFSVHRKRRVWSNFRRDDDRKVLEIIVQPRKRAQTILAELRGDIVGGFVDPFGFEAATFELIRRDVGQRGFDFFGFTKGRRGGGRMLSGLGRSTTQDRAQTKCDDQCAAMEKWHRIGIVGRGLSERQGDATGRDLRLAASRIRKVGFVDPRNRKRRKCARSLVVIYVGRGNPHAAASALAACSGSSPGKRPAFRKCACANSWAMT